MIKSFQEETVFIAGEQDCLVAREYLIGLFTEGRDSEVGEPLARNRCGSGHPRFDLRVEAEVHSVLFTCLRFLRINCRHLLSSPLVWQIATDVDYAYSAGNSQGIN